MNNLYVILFTLFLLILPSTNAQWMQTNGPPGGTVYTLLSNDSNIFAGTYQNGVFRSTNNGQNWSQTSLCNQNVYSLAAIGSSVFAATGTGIYRSTNFGQNWNIVNSNTSITALAASGVFLYSSSNSATNNGIFFSSNNGQNWTQIFSGSVRTMVVDGIYLIAGGTNNGVFYTTNNGLNWTLTELNNRTVLSLFASDSGFYAGTDNNGLYISTNYGKTWSQSSLNDRDVLSVIKLNSDIIAGTNDGAYFSSNNGLNWLQTNLDSLSVYSIVKNSYGFFAGTGNSGIYCSTNSGQQWFQTPLLDQYIYSFSVSDPYIYSGSLGVQYSTNGGQNWIQTSLCNKVVKSTASSGPNVFAATYSNGIYASSDYGQNWHQTTFSNNPVSVAIKGSTVFASFYVGPLFRSTDYGNTWIPLSIGWVNLVATNDDFVFATYDYNYYHCIYISTDEGLSWTSSFCSNTSTLSIAANGSIIYAGTYQNGVFRSTDNGQTWNQTALNNKVVNALAVSGSNVYAGTYVYGIYASSNNGVTWQQKNEGLLDSTILSLCVKDDYLYAGTEGSSVWRRAISDITSFNIINGEVPSKFHLTQNFPNPFNPETKIQFGLPKSGNVKLSVYDASGREIEELVNQQMNAGTFEVTWNGAAYSSGAYFYKLITDGFTETKKMILVK